MLPAQSGACPGVPARIFLRHQRQRRVCELLSRFRIGLAGLESFAEEQLSMVGRCAVSGNARGRARVDIVSADSGVVAGLERGAEWRPDSRAGWPVFANPPDVEAWG